jgi:hypothetical protein
MSDSNGISEMLYSLFPLVLVIVFSITIIYGINVKFDSEISYKIKFSESLEKLKRVPNIEDFKVLVKFPTGRFKEEDQIMEKIRNEHDLKIQYEENKVYLII